MSRQLGQAHGSVGAAWIQDGSLYVYRHRQELLAVTIPTYQLTFVVSRDSILDQALSLHPGMAPAHVHELHSRWTYRVGINGLEPTHYMPPPTRSILRTIRGVGYAGG